MSLQQSVTQTFPISGESIFEQTFEWQHHTPGTEAGMDLPYGFKQTPNLDLLPVQEYFYCLF